MIPQFICLAFNLLVDVIDDPFRQQTIIHLEGHKMEVPRLVVHLHIPIEITGHITAFEHRNPIQFHICRDDDFVAFDTETGHLLHLAPFIGNRQKLVQIVAFQDNGRITGRLAGKRLLDFAVCRLKACGIFRERQEGEQ